MESLIEGLSSVPSERCAQLCPRSPRPSTRLHVVKRHLPDEHQHPSLPAQAAPPQLPVGTKMTTASPPFILLLLFYFIVLFFLGGRVIQSKRQ